MAAHFSMDNLNDATPGWNYDIYDLSAGDYVEVYVSQNSGSNMTVQASYHSEPIPWMNQPHSIVLDVPPLAGLIFFKS